MSTPLTALITGASSGIGRALAHLFARDGYALVLVARRTDALNALATELSRAHGVTTRVLPADLTRADAPRELYDELQRGGVVVDALVNNAGFGLQGEFARLPLDRQIEMINLNATSLTALTRLCLPGMIERRRGGVLNVGSTAAFQPGPLMAVYYATKAYVLSFSEAIADEVAGTGVRVSCLAPGPTATGFAAEAGITDAPLFTGPTMSVDAVARIGYEGWGRGEPLVIPGARNRIGALMVRFAPRAYVRKVVRGLNTRA
jgi:uncharacterized protein